MNFTSPMSVVWTVCQILQCQIAGAVLFAAKALTIMTSVTSGDTCSTGRIFSGGPDVLDSLKTVSYFEQKSHLELSRFYFVFSPCLLFKIVLLFIMVQQCTEIR